MKKFKQLAILLATILAASSMAVMPVSAKELSLEDQDYQDTFMPALSEGEYGQAVFTSSRHDATFIAVTDSSGLEEGKISDATKDNPITAIWEQDYPNDRVEFLTDETTIDGETYTFEYTSEDSPYTYYDDVDEKSLDLLKSYGEDSRYYEVSILNSAYFDNAATYEEADANLTRIAQEFMRTHDNVKDVFIASGIRTRIDFVWNGRIDRLISEWDIPEGMDEDEFFDGVRQKLNAVQEELTQQYAVWKEQIDQWKQTVDTENMTPEELYLSRLEHHIPTNYEIWRFVYDGVDKMREVASEVALTVEPGREFEGNTNKFLFSGNGECYTTLTSVKPATTAETLSTSSAFVKGNLDDDPNINAADASQILTISANIGAGNTSSVTEEQKNSADVNNDGIINAVDASLILQYSAAKGAGFSGSLEEFLNS